MASLISNSAMVRGRDEVYVAEMPLRATKGPPQLLMSAAYSLNFWDLQHFMVIIKPCSPYPHSQVLVFDFQPTDPEDIYVALAVLSGKAVPDVEGSANTMVGLPLEAVNEAMTSFVQTQLMSVVQMQLVSVVQTQLGSVLEPILRIVDSQAGSVVP